MMRSRLIVAAAVAVLGACNPPPLLSDSAEPAVDGGTDAASATDSGVHDHGSGVSGTHVHAVHFWLDTELLVVATHTGVFRTQAGTDGLLQLRDGGDFMSMVHDPFDPNVYWGSGHWAAGGFSNWGFIESTDGGVTWQQISLNGTDFHYMAVSADQAGLVVGTFSGQIYVSTDSGRNWDMYPWANNVIGIEVDDPVGPVLLIANPAGIDRVTIPSLASTPLVTATVTGLGLYGDGFIYGRGDGAIVTCDAMGGVCNPLASSPPSAATSFLEGPGGSLFVRTTSAEIHHTHDPSQGWELVLY